MRAGDGNEAERLEILCRHRDAVRSRLEAESRHLAAIERKIAVYLGEADTCH